MQESIFTKIIKGEIPCHKIYEDDKTLAFLDIHPAVTGHTLVIPKVQVDHLWDLSEEDYVALMQTAKIVAQRLRERLPTKRVGMRVEGFDVPHAHIHLLPANSGSDVRASSDHDSEPDHNVLIELAKKLAF